ncbi:MAG TPA: CarD family transcriptional regulator, partial [Candidatus Limnocylindria bacterium]|nr:CarD family transcriptional regulator [Candidatus Limnocylindria bacterium]
MTVGAPEIARVEANRRVATLTDDLVGTLPDTTGELRVPSAARGAYLAARRAVLPPGTPLVVVARTDDDAHYLADDLAAWLTRGHVRVLPERAALPLERALPEHEESAERLAVLADLGGRRHDLVLVASLQALVQRTLAPEQLAAGRLELRVGGRVGQRALLGSLIAGGYEPVVEVSGVGEMANRGGIVDVWPPGAVEPLRIELFGDEVDSIRSFDPISQGSRRRHEQATLLPASEFLPARGWASLAELAPARRTPQLDEDLAHLEQGDLGEAAETWARLLTAGPAADHLPATANVVLADAAELRAVAAALDEQAHDRRAGLVAAGELPVEWPLPYDADRVLEQLGERAAELLEEQAEVDAGFGAAPVLPGRADRLGAWLRQLGEQGHRVVVTTDQASRVGELLDEAGLTSAVTAQLTQPPPVGGIGLVHGSLRNGFVHEPTDLVLLTDRELFGVTRVRRLTPSRKVVTRDLIGKLQPGDPVVHVDHGIARYVGMTQRTYGGDTKEYLQLDFAGEDKIYLPTDQIGRITRYSGGPAPALSKLGGTDWERTKRRVRRAVADLARELLEIYAAREAAPGFAFSPDTTWQRELEESFPYTETRDQARSIEEVKADMLRQRPMDRLVVGDVGYGKTEVAMRAAFKAVQDGKQVAVLVPTTLLVNQHFS